MTVNEILDRINRRADIEPYFVSRFVGWLASANPDFLTTQLDRMEVFEANQRAVKGDPR